MNHRFLSIVLAASACGASPNSTENGVVQAKLAETDTFAKASNAFAFDLWRKLGSTNENLVFSPASISMALAMTWAGARGESAHEMAEVMYFGDSAETLHQSAGVTLAGWNDPERDSYQLRVANRLFGENSFPFRDEFIVFSKNNYEAPLERLNFRGAPDTSRQHINEWVEDQTEERIMDLLPPSSISRKTALVLVNAIYFKGTWLTEFSEKATEDAPFYPTAEGQTKTVKMMNATGQYAYAHTPELQIVELPYDGEELAMTLVLPTARHGLAMLESSMTSASLEAWTKLLNKREVRVSLPRFKLEPEAVQLSGELQDMGMKRAFSPEFVGFDFDPMAKLEETNLQLFISEVFHKAFVEVNEEGTEAAAATAVVMNVRETSAAPAPAPPYFHADQPFLFFIRNLKDGTVLFMGRVGDPSSSD